MATVKTIQYTIREIVWDNGKTEIICMNNQEYAGMMRRKGIKKTIISNRKLFTFTIELKNNS
jgi:cytoplasmic iron level regulating protein YaaA (DUF328/UPF0246 family)